MVPSRPYLIRALYDWMVDNGWTPHVLVDADAEGVDVPEGVIQDGQVVLNIGPTAVKDLVLGNDWITFEARFSGVPSAISVPSQGVLGIYARENGKGMLFGEEEDGGPTQPGAPEDPKPGGKPSLRVVK